MLAHSYGPTNKPSIIVFAPSRQQPVLCLNDFAGDAVLFCVVEKWGEEELEPEMGRALTIYFDINKLSFAVGQKQ